MTQALKNWFDKYSESHNNKTNKLIHFICVPLIIFSILGMLSLKKIETADTPLFHLNWRFSYAHIFLIVVYIFYLRHSFKIFLGILVYTIACLLIIDMIRNQQVIQPWSVFAFIFIAAWLGQFAGHKKEGRKPSFLTDLVFLLIGPAWIFSFLYSKLRISY